MGRRIMCNFIALLILLCGLLLPVKAMQISVLSVVWRSAGCQPLSMRIHWWHGDGGSGWCCLGVQSGPAGFPEYHNWVWCPELTDELPPMYSVIDSVWVTLDIHDTFGQPIEQIIALQPTDMWLLYDGCAPGLPWEIPESAFDGCNPMGNSTAIVEDDLLQAFELKQNYPNPFNPSTTIKFSLQSANHISLKVYDLKGELVATLANEQMSAGEHQLDFHAGNLSSGIYLYTLIFDDRSVTKRMLLLK